MLARAVAAMAPLPLYAKSPCTVGVMSLTLVPDVPTCVNVCATVFARPPLIMFAVRWATQAVVPLHRPHTMSFPTLLAGLSWMVITTDHDAPPPASRE